MRRGLDCPAERWSQPILGEFPRGFVARCLRRVKAVSHGRIACCIVCTANRVARRSAVHGRGKKQRRATHRRALHRGRKGKEISERGANYRWCESRGIARSRRQYRSRRTIGSIKSGVRVYGAGQHETTQSPGCDAFPRIAARRHSHQYFTQTAGLKTTNDTVVFGPLRQALFAPAAGNGSE